MARFKTYPCKRCKKRKLTSQYVELKRTCQDCARAWRKDMLNELEAIKSWGIPIPLDRLKDIPLLKLSGYFNTVKANAIKTLSPEVLQIAYPELEETCD